MPVDKIPDFVDVGQYLFGLAESEIKRLGFIADEQVDDGMPLVLAKFDPSGFAVGHGKPPFRVVKFPLPVSTGYKGSMGADISFATKVRIWL